MLLTGQHWPRHFGMSKHLQRPQPHRNNLKGSTMNSSKLLSQNRIHFMIEPSTVRKPFPLSPRNHQRSQAFNPHNFISRLECSLSRVFLKKEQSDPTLLVLAPLVNILLVWRVLKLRKTRGEKIEKLNPSLSHRPC